MFATGKPHFLLDAATPRPTRGGLITDASSCSTDSSVPVRGYDLAQVLACIPHRYPMLLVDRLIEYKPPNRARALKNVTTNEPYFAGQEHARMIMPTVFILEAIAQTCGLLCAVTGIMPEARMLLLAKIDKCRIKRAVVPGDQLFLDVELVRAKHRIATFNAQGILSSGAVVAMATLMLVAAR